MDSNKPAQNIQDSFLNTARKERLSITIYLLSGVKLTGRIRSFDKYSVVLEANGQEQLIFKHAISTVVMGTGGLDTCRPRGASGESRRVGASSRGSGERFGHRRIKGVFGLGSSHSKKSRGTRVRADVCLSAPKSSATNRERERAFLVGLEVRARAAAAAPRERSRRRPRLLAMRRDAASASGAEVPNGQAQHSRVRCRRVSGRTAHAGGECRSEVVGENFCSGATGPIPRLWLARESSKRSRARRPRSNADVVLFDHDLSPSQQRNIEKVDSAARD